jgi:hypothetical protein
LRAAIIPKMSIILESGSEYNRNAQWGYFIDYYCTIIHCIRCGIWFAVLLLGVLLMCNKPWGTTVFWNQNRWDVNNCNYHYYFFVKRQKLVCFLSYGANRRERLLGRGSQ